MIVYKLEYILPIVTVVEIMGGNPENMEFERKFNLNGEIGEMTIFVKFLSGYKLRIILKSDKVNREFEFDYKHFKDNMNIVTVSFSPDLKGELTVLKLNLHFRREEDKMTYIDNRDMFVDLESSIFKHKRDKLLSQVDFLDFNYILNIIYCGYMLNELNFNNISNCKETFSVLEKDYNDIRALTLSKLGEVGIYIKEDAKRIKDIIHKVNSIYTITPEDCAYLLISTMPKGFRDKNKYLDNLINVRSSIVTMLEKYKDINNL